MQSHWVRVLQGLRAQKHLALFSLVSGFNDVTFTDSQIIVPAHNATEYQMLQKNLPLMQELAGGNYCVIQAPPQPEAQVYDPYVDQLKDLFGEKLEIQ